MTHRDGAGSYYSPGLVDEVAEEIERKLQSDPDNVQLRFSLANVYLRQGRPEAAVKELDRLVAKQPTAELVNALGRAALAAGDYERATREFSRLAQEQPRWPDVAFHQALVARSLGQFEPALQHLGRAIELNPRYREALYERASLLEEMGRPNDALVDYKRVIALFFAEYQFNDIDAFRYDLSVLFANPDLLDESIRQLRRLVDKYPGFADVHYKLGQALEAKGLTREAALSYRRALEINPRYDTARRSFWKRG